MKLFKYGLVSFFFSLAFFVFGNESTPKDLNFDGLVFYTESYPPFNYKEKKVV